MRVKDAVLTFVAMGGFAVPVAFQTPASTGAVSGAAAQIAATGQPLPEEDKKSSGA